MRSQVLLGLTAAAVLGTAAFAQETPATPPAAEPAPAVEAAPAPAPAPAPEAAPAAPEAPPAPPPPPPAPTDITSINVLNVLDRVCTPLVRGGDLKALAAPLGFKLKKGVWVLQYAKGYTITVTPPGTNPEVCTVDVQHPVDGVTPLIIDAHNWAIARGWSLYRNDKIVTDLERTTRSWENRQPGTLEAVVLMSSRKADGTPLNKKYDQTQLLYSLYKTQ
jgi:hypothetical protein